MGPLQFHIFINEFNNGGECTLSKSDDDTKLCGVADTLQGKARFQNDLDILDKCCANNQVKLKQHKCKVLHL